VAGRDIAFVYAGLRIFRRSRSRREAGHRQAERTETETLFVVFFGTNDSAHTVSATSSACLASASG
jgi:hypothetical protein